MNPANPPMDRALRNARAAVLCSMFVMVPNAMAHPGHGVFEQGPRHWLTQSDHLTVLLGVALTCWVLGLLCTKPVLRRYAYCGSLLALLIAIALAGVPVG